MKLLTLEFDNFDWIIFFPHSKYFKIAKHRFLCLRMTIHFDAKEITLVLPIKFTLFMHDPNERRT